MYKRYGKEPFRKDCFTPVRNRNFPASKPIGGIWASPEDAELSWEVWCRENMPEFIKGKNVYRFSLEGANVLHVRSRSDLSNLPVLQDFNKMCFTDIEYLDFEKLSDMYDAIELHLSEGDYRLSQALYGWDCDSVLIMNPEVIKNEEEVERRA